MFAAWIAIVNVGVFAWSLATRDPRVFARSGTFPAEAILAWFVGTAAAIVWFVRSYTAG